MSISNILTQHARKIKEASKEIRLSPTKLLVEYFGLPSSANEGIDNLYNDNAPMHADSFERFKQWYKQKGGKVFTAQEDGLTFFVGKSADQDKQDWSWDPEEQKLYFDRINAYPYSKFFNKQF